MVKYAVVADNTGLLSVFESGLYVCRLASSKEEAAGYVQDFLDEQDIELEDISVYNLGTGVEVSVEIKLK